jgi:hypothetical protein
MKLTNDVVVGPKVSTLLTPKPTTDISQASFLTP